MLNQKLFLLKSEKFNFHNFIVGFFFFYCICHVRGLKINGCKNYDTRRGKSKTTKYVAPTQLLSSSFFSFFWKVSWQLRPYMYQCWIIYCWGIMFAPRILWIRYSTTNQNQKIEIKREVKNIKKWKINKNTHNYLSVFISLAINTWTIGGLLPVSS